ncbi:hypothetical protein MMC26_003997 [Xylographa opegraphella]|nr:hypothetical protein [Xylographa opegraphella]
MASVMHHLVSRGLDVVQQHQANPDQAFGPFKVPTWGIVLVGITIALYFALSLGIRYTYAELIGTLAMIEDPSTTMIIRTSEVDAPLPSADESEKAPHLEQEVLLVKSKPITAKFRTAIAHLRAHGGFFSRFRGAHVLAAYYLAYHFMCSFLFRFVPQTLAYRAIITVAASTILCRFSATWTHIVISEASEKRFFQRVPALPAFRKLAGPTFLNAVAKQVVFLGLVSMFNTFGLQPYAADPSLLGELNDAERVTVWLHAFIVLTTAILAAVFVIIPTHVALKRVQASLLPEDDESIVPFDRTFNGKVVPEILGGSGRVGMAEAWKSFDWNGRVRLFKVYAKVAAMQGALFMLFTVVLAGEVRVILGDQLDHVVIAATRGAR